MVQKKKKEAKKQRRGFELTLMASSDVEQEGQTSHGRGVHMCSSCCISVWYGSTDCSIAGCLTYHCCTV